MALYFTASNQFIKNTAVKQLGHMKLRNQLGTGKKQKNWFSSIDQCQYTICKFFSSEKHADQQYYVPFTNSSYILSKICTYNK